MEKKDKEIAELMDLPDADDRVRLGLDNDFMPPKDSKYWETLEVYGKKAPRLDKADLFFIGVCLGVGLTTLVWWWVFSHLVIPL